jgi:hypothetical protein
MAWLICHAGTSWNYPRFSRKCGRIRLGTLRDVDLLSQRWNDPLKACFESADFVTLGSGNANQRYSVQMMA